MSEVLALEGLTQKEAVRQLRAILYSPYFGVYISDGRVTVIGRKGKNDLVSPILKNKRAPDGFELRQAPKGFYVFPKGEPQPLDTYRGAIDTIILPLEADYSGIFYSVNLGLEAPRSRIMRFYDSSRHVPGFGVHFVCRHQHGAAVEEDKFALNLTASVYVEDKRYREKSISACDAWKKEVEQEAKKALTVTSSSL